MKQIEIYTDGACSGNPGPGGWGAVLLYGEKKKELSGGKDHTTNQQMELTAAIEALKRLREPCCVRLYSDSAYLINAFTRGWLQRWQRNGWQTQSGQPTANQDLWEELLCLAGKHQITWIKVKGHSDNTWNNRCDTLARRALKQQTNS